MKTAPGKAAPSVADRGEVRQILKPSGISFVVRDLKRVAYGSKVAEYTLLTAVGELDGDLFRPVDGRPPFAIARAIRAKYGGRWERTTRWSDAFALEVCAAVLSQLDADENAQRDQS